MKNNFFFIFLILVAACATSKKAKRVDSSDGRDLERQDSAITDSQLEEIDSKNAEFTDSTVAIGDSTLQSKEWLEEQFESYGIEYQNVDRPDETLPLNPGKGGLAEKGITVYLCNTPGERRVALPEEKATYCTCIEGLSNGSPVMVWTCFGPSQEERQSNTIKECVSSTFNRGQDPGSCLSIWSCGNESFGLSCIESECVCLENGKALDIIVESFNHCPDIDEINFHCGFYLIDEHSIQSQEDSAP